MLTSLTVISLLSAAVFAQSSNTTASPLIPSGISSGCSSTLNSLNNNATLQACISPIIEATSAYASGSSSTPSASQLGTICSTSICDPSLFRAALSTFASGCSSELTSNKDITRLYDVMYIMSPMMTAMCSKGDNGNYCVLPSSSTSSSASASPSGVSVATEASQAQQFISTSAGTVNDTTFATYNIPFMFLPTNISSAQCNTCTRNVMTAYINWESDCPYAPGLSQSTLLITQNPLYSSVTNICGSNFLSGVVQAAGGLGTGSSSNGSLRSVAFDIRTISVALVSMFAALLF
ncbi:hypothetical protein BDP27DRAFT_1381258 [Rhodocollybia butyracea]|uniref:Uncharacterized protein n=1 Tax=Rhodocollybia butyracea TaxID=206335 RepID=A0A9P5Q4C6_9AGAR|nr:hypothetical protein BDP27DRAFT_1381258 [Rhodocollybia butyracea]